MKNRGDKSKLNNKMVELNPTISINLLNVNGLNIQLKDRDYQVRFKKLRLNYILSIRNSL